MKAAIFSFFCLVLGLSSSAFAQSDTNEANNIEFQADTVNQPLQVTVRGVIKSGDQIFSYEDLSYTQTRFVVWSSNKLRRDNAEGAYAYYTSSGFAGYSHPLTASELNQLRQYLMLVPRCPITLYFDRTTFKLLKVHTKCDPLAAAGPVNNAG